MRADLLALSDDSLITLANRGILKRAMKENAAAPPELSESSDGTVEAVFADGTRTTLTAGVTLEAAPCTCGSTTVCRHRVMVVLHYRAKAAVRESEVGSAATESMIDSAAETTGSTAGHATTESAAGVDDTAARKSAASADSSAASASAADASTVAARESATVDAAARESAAATEEQDVAAIGETRSAGVELAGATPWTPAEFSDDQLRELLGTRAFAAARKAHRAGYRATVRRATPQDPVAAVELSAVTVRFLVPGNLGYARADASRGARPDAIALAVWAFRVADAVDPTADALEVTVGNAADGSAAVTATGSVLPPLADLLNDGVAHAGPALPAIFSTALRTLDAASARWPHDALVDLLDQLAAYRDRGARHDPLLIATLITELVARQRASTRDWVPVLGTEEAASTPLRHLRLTGLGARITGDSESRTVETYLAHPEARIVLTLPVTTAIPDGSTPPSAAALAARRTGSARLGDLAAGNVVTESAIRSANRSVRLANSRVARTSVLPSTGDWSTLPPELLIGDLEAEAARLTTLAPTVIRPRVRGESVRAVVVDHVEEIRYLPGEQRLEATLHAPSGTAVISESHTIAAPGALDALAHTLSGEAGSPRYIAGSLIRRHGRLVLRPTAVVAGRTVHIPCYASTTHVIPPAAAHSPEDPLAEAITAALALTAEVPHRGVRHLPPTWYTRTIESTRALRRAGLHTAATTLEALGRALPTASSAQALELWATTHLRLQLTADHL